MQRFTKFVLGATCVIAGILSQNPKVTAHDFTWDNLAMACIKLDKNYDVDANVEWYMENYRTDTWKLARNDEFLLHEKKAETKKLFQNRIDEFDLSQTFELRANIDIGDYDFTNEEFPATTSGPDSYWYKNSSKYSDSIPYTLKLFFKNHEFVDAVPMQPAAAKAFVQTRKQKNGYVDRTVSATIEFRIVKLRGKGELLAEALKVTFYRDSARRQPLGPTLVWKPTTESSNEQPVPTANSPVRQPIGNADLGVLGFK
ncbi:MAG: DUF4852 domain-containing protein [Planctomycetales bacterium]|nr:DUF4852 domain-containing protein [Planctomycetales bacterium]